MRRLRQAFFFLPSLLFATVNEPLRCEFFSGYRNDRTHWHLQDPGAILTYTENNRDIEYWENGLSLRAIHRDLCFSLRGAYGTFGRGTVFQQLDYLPAQPSFQFSSSGWTADGEGYFSYAVNLTADRTYKVILLPLIGYSAYFERLRRMAARPNPFTNGEETIYSQLPGELAITWYGLFLGVGFMIQPGGRLIFNGGWHYHWLNTKFQSSVWSQSILNGFSQDEGFALKVAASGNIGQTGWLQMDYILDSFWRAGFGSQIHYFSSRVLDTTLKPSQSPFNSLPGFSSLSQRLKFRWTAISVWGQISREF